MTAVAAVDLVHGGIDRMLLRGDWLPWARFACHGLALLTLVAWTLIAASGSRVPRPAALMAVVVTGLAAVALPAVQPLGMLPAGGAWPAGHPRLAALVTWLTGTAAGWIAGGAGRSHACAALTLLGAAFGWQVVTVVTAVRTVGRLGWRWAASRTPARS
jgi:hypothetical protein